MTSWVCFSDVLCMVGQCPRLNENAAQAWGSPKTRTTTPIPTTTIFFQEAPQVIQVPQESKEHPIKSNPKLRKAAICGSAARQVHTALPSPPHFRSSHARARRTPCRVGSVDPQGPSMRPPQWRSCPCCPSTCAELGGRGRRDVDLVDEDGRTRHAQANRWDSEEVASEFFRGCCENWSSYRPTD